MLKDFNLTNCANVESGKSQGIISNFFKSGKNSNAVPIMPLRLRHFTTNDFSPDKCAKAASVFIGWVHLIMINDFKLDKCAKRFKKRQMFESKIGHPP